MTITSIRKQLIQELTDVVNEREKTSLSFEQMNAYIGNLHTESLDVWVDETKRNVNPVCAHSVLEQWEEILKMNVFLA